MGKFQIVQVVFLLGVSIVEISGHGMMWDPPNRSSLWRFDPDAPSNYNDNENFCGGFEIQHKQNGGKCGVCGDNYTDTIPRANENTGKYGQGKIVAHYEEGSQINVTIILTANHLGYFTYSICNLEDPTKPESDGCFQELFLADGTKKYLVSEYDYMIKNTIQLPKGFKCKHCVLRWHYECGNSWGICEDGTEGMGCGIQENFRSCTDIAIL